MFSVARLKALAFSVRYCALSDIESPGTVQKQTTESMSNPNRSALMIVAFRMIQSNEAYQEPRIIRDEVLETSNLVDNHLMKLRLGGIRRFA